MEIAKEVFFFLSPALPDIVKKDFNYIVARKFGILPPRGCGMQALAISQTQALFSLPSKFLFYTCSHAGALDPKEPRVDKQISPERGVRA